MNTKKSSLRILRYPEALPKSPGTVVATLGSFDGIHIGHQSLAHALQNSPAHERVFISFYPHPIEVLSPGTVIPRISTLSQNIEILDSYGITLYYLIRFSKKLSELTPEEFLTKVLVEKLHVNHLLIGQDARVGRGREGTPEVIREILEGLGATLEVIPTIAYEGQRSSSRIIREFIRQGNFEKVQVLLGRRFALEGKVIHGAGRGGTIGIPTANLHITSQILPPLGVYATISVVKGGQFRSVTNIGKRPTFGDEGHISVETHMLDAGIQKLYGTRMKVYFVEKIRGEKKFLSATELVTQITNDIACARTILDNLPRTELST